MSIETQDIKYQVDGKTFIGYLAVDTKSTQPLGAVLIAPEWWGRNDYAKTRAEQLAAEGFIAMAMDVYGDAEVASTPERAAELMNSARDTEGAIEARFDAAYQALTKIDKVDETQISVMGYCFGGAIAIAMARAGKQLKLVASFHGALQTPTPMKESVFDGEILVFNGAADPMVTPEIVTEFKAEMDSARANYRLIDYPGVVHGFTNPAATEKGRATGMPLAYDDHADLDSYAQTLKALRAA